MLVQHDIDRGLKRVYLDRVLPTLANVKPPTPPPGQVQVNCCPAGQEIPVILFAQVSNNMGCACLDGLFVKLTFDGVNTWSGAVPACGDNFVINVACTGFGLGNLTLAGYCFGQSPNPMPPTDATCTPPFAADYLAYTQAGCCGSGLVDIHISPLACCGSLPATIYAHMADAGGCACLDGLIVPLNFDGDKWTGSVAACGDTLAISVRCNAQVPGCNNYGLTASCAGQFPDPVYPASCTCTPFSLLYNAYQPAGCCGGRVNLTVNTSPT